MVLILSDGLRKQKQVDAKSSLELQVSAPSLRSSINQTLADLDIAPASILVDLITGMASLDWNDKDSIGQQMTDLVGQTFLGVGQLVANAIHPVLGIAFSIFSSLFGLYDADTNPTEQILAQVDKMISVKVADYHINIGVASSLLAAADQVNQASASTNWDLLPDLLTPRFSEIFSPCSSSPSGHDCQNLWKGKTSGNSMVLEIHFLELMITSAAEVFSKKGNIAGLKTFMLKIQDMAKLAKDHYTTLNGIRRNFASNEHGLVKNQVVCYGMRTNVRCRVDAATDLWLGTGFCAVPERPKTDTYENMKNLLQNIHDQCFQDMKVEIVGELEWFRNSTETIYTTATKMYDAF